jgi:outer membrane lipoprotein-sorting protein
MKTYEAQADLKYISNKNINTYEVDMYCDVNGPYKIKVLSPENSAGNTTVFDGKYIYQYNSKINSCIKTITKETSERSEIFLSNFIKNYNHSMDSSVSHCNIEKKMCTVLETKIPQENNYLNSEKLFIDNKTLNPIKLVIFDKDNLERIIVRFNSFKYNVNFKSSTFKSK